jgi:large subunit ribosomal protein L7/L12
MAVTKEDILESISKMTVMEVVDLISDMEEKFGVTAAAAVAAAPAAAGGGEAAEKKLNLMLPWRIWVVIKFQLLKLLEQ